MRIKIGRQDNCVDLKEAEFRGQEEVMMNKKDEELGLDPERLFETEDYEPNKNHNSSSEEEEDDNLEGRNQEEDAYDSPSEFQYGSSWPKTYRESMDMFANVSTSSVGYLGTSVGASSYSSSSCHSRRRSPEFDQTLTKPFISTTTSDKDEVPQSIKSTSQKFSYHEVSPGQKCSFTQSVLNGMNVLCGVGLLSTPYAVKEGGWSGLFLLFAFGAISCYTGILLKRCLDSSPGLQTYPDIGQSAFGSAGRLAVAIVLYLELYAAAVEFLTLMSDNLSSMFPNVQIDSFGVHLDSHYFFAILTTLLVLPTVWLRNLSLLSYLSVGGVAASLLVVLCLLWVGVVDDVGFHPSGTVLELTNFPIALGLYSACYGGHSVFPNIYTSMEKPSQFPIVLIICFLTCWLLYTGVAVCGYLMFGDSLKSQFTLNMPKRFVSTKIAVWTTVVNPLSKYALTLYPVALSLEELIPSALQKSYCASIIVRTILVLSTLVVSLTVPYFGLVMSLIGSFCTMLVALIFPCACYLSLLGQRLSRLEIGANIFIILVGGVCCCIGSFTTIMRIFQEMGILNQS